MFPQRPSRRQAQGLGSVEGVCHTQEGDRRALEGDGDTQLTEDTGHALKSSRYQEPLAEYQHSHSLAREGGREGA